MNQLESRTHLFVCLFACLSVLLLVCLFVGVPVFCLLFICYYYQLSDYFLVYLISCIHLLSPPFLSDNGSSSIDMLKPYVNKDGTKASKVRKGKVSVWQFVLISSFFLLFFFSNPLFVYCFFVFLFFSFIKGSLTISLVSRSGRTRTLWMRQPLHASTRCDSLLSYFAFLVFLLK